MVQQVAAGLIRHDGKILIAKRKAHDEMGGQWEFPGGTVMPGEPPEQSMQREIAEELGVRACVGRLLAKERFFYGGRDLEVWFFEAFPESFDFTLTEHDEFAWVNPGDLGAYDFPSADRNVAALLCPLEG
ncbi:MAG TPA: (deoxy)nucleoside triphosphate pyrophosphohydrolase [Candidatus Omnitrophota bacterium]|nr:(deoxy)nucleoside triphosphate pyrophosphohydrolase [Candidatus Omnitrophota bacterium]HPN56739.1 (deoxy)nucleoside triphosphate pyrophosphohydrolase [Candidatus Omnitrophota bacterium]